VGSLESEIVDEGKFVSMLARTAFPLKVNDFVVAKSIILAPSCDLANLT
jgi:hypothetical protein